MSQVTQLLQSIPIGVGEVVSFIAGVLISVLGAEYRERRRRTGEAVSREAEKAQKEQEALVDWYEDTQSILTHGVYLVRQAQGRPDFQYEQVMQDISDLHVRLIDQTHPHPNGVPEPVINVIEGVIEIYGKARLVTEVGDQKEGLEMAAELFEMGKMEFDGNDSVDLKESMEEAGEVSEPFQEFIGSVDDAGVSTQEFADTVGGMLGDWETEDFVFMMAFVADSEEDINDTIEISLRYLLHITQNISIGAYQVLEDYKTEAAAENSG